MKRFFEADVVTADEMFAEVPAMLSLDGNRLFFYAVPLVPFVRL